MSSGQNVDSELREIAQALADSGSYEDSWDIEMALLARGHSPAVARRVTADDAVRASLDERCFNALRRRA
jgi:hypothetical protein